MKSFHVDAALASEVRERLGAEQPTDLDGVAALYERWCATVPFDGAAKALAVREGRIPPGADPAEFFEHWLTTGLGGTCWGHVAGLAALLADAGIDSRVGLDRMLRDGVIDFHGFLVVPDGDRRLALDVVHVAGRPLPIEAGARGTHPIYSVGFVEEDGRLLHWFDSPATWQGDGGRYALLSTDLDAADVAACFLRGVCHRLGVRSHRLFLRRTPPDSWSRGGPPTTGPRTVPPSGARTTSRTSRSSPTSTRCARPSASPPRADGWSSAPASWTPATASVPSRPEPERAAWPASVRQGTVPDPPVGGDRLFSAARRWTTVLIGNACCQTVSGPPGGVVGDVPVPAGAL
ncbi:MAG: hypothetical protein U5R31_11205 [Acidimicrobiia bacterium]|nr:hypothetical protein [Acidimicrobiia bacterium]